MVAPHDRGVIDQKEHTMAPNHRRNDTHHRHTIIIVVVALAVALATLPNLTPTARAAVASIATSGP